mgnify:CR=1 FL=1
MQILIGGGHDADIDFDRLHTTNSGKLTLLQHAEELGLCHRAQVADFVKKKGASVGLFENPDLVVNRAGKGASFVSKKFTFKKRFGNSSAVDDDERRRRRFRVSMNGVSHQFFSRSTFSKNNDVCLGSRNSPYHFENRLNSR